MDTIEISKAIEAKKDDITLSNIDAKKADFCSVWPQARMGLEMLKDLIKNPIAKAAVGIVISAGDAVSSKICPQ